MEHIVFIPLTRTHAEFYVGVARKLKKQGIASTFISCHERSCKWIEEQGFKAYNFHEAKRDAIKLYSDDQFKQLLSRYNIDRLQLWTNHEREFYWIYNQNILNRKFFASLAAFEKIFGSIAETSTVAAQPTVIQELGGFLSVISSFFVARQKGLECYFIEPSFYRGRVFFIKNSLGAVRASQANPAALPTPAEVEYIKQYVRETVAKKSLIIPSKDKHHYSGVLAKFFNFHNLKRLVQKLLDKYVLGYEEEFQYVGVHFRKHLYAIINKYRMARHYHDIPKGRFIYFPLHVPADMALTLRAPLFFDQCYVVEQIAKQLPVGVPLCLKEHPAMVGAISAKKLKDLLKRNSNIRLLKPSLNNFDVLSRAERVFTVNSKAGSEALIVGTPVTLLSESFYDCAPGVTKLQSWQDLTKTPIERTPVDEERLLEYLKVLWSHTIKGEVFSLTDDVFREYAQAIMGLAPLTQSVKHTDISLS